jgi:hypothetical protein
MSCLSVSPHTRVFNDLWLTLDYNNASLFIDRILHCKKYGGQTKNTAIN